MQIDRHIITDRRQWSQIEPHCLGKKSDMEMAMIDGTILKVHRHGQGSKALLSLQAAIVG